MNDEENFVSRWSRRKLKANADATAAAPAKLPAAAAATPPAAGPQLSVPDSPDDGIGPEYREFFDPRVDEKLRRTALRKLFGDPHFNVMDGLDTYVDDYSKPDPIPEAMLRQLHQAKNLFLFDDEKKTNTEGEAAVAAGNTTAAPPAATATAAAPSEAAPASAPGQDAGATTGPAFAPSREGSANG